MYCHTSANPMAPTVPFVLKWHTAKMYSNMALQLMDDSRSCAKLRMNGKRLSIYRAEDRQVLFLDANAEQSQI